MPCTTYEPSSGKSVTEQMLQNEKKYDLRLPDDQALAAMVNIACELGRAVEKAENAGFESKISETTNHWYSLHREQDKERLREEIKQLEESRNKLLLEADKINQKIASKLAAE